MSAEPYRNELADPDALGAHAEHVLLRGMPWKRFAVIGDSIAEGIGDRVDGYMDLSWSDRVVRGLRSHRPELAYLNLGRRGLLAREVREQQLQQALAFAPDLAAVCAGGNDTMTDPFDPDVLEGDLDALVAPLRAAGADVFLYTLFDIGQAVELPEPWGSRLRDRMATLALVTFAVARRHDALVVDCATDPRCGDRSIYSADMLHLNRRGHAVAAGRTLHALAGAIERRRESFAFA
ncbi:SGNH/GDSL hydrolase family protein [Conexibacter sp. CPCC 206217]|uniref:SGNH/GDSL hydrolase family protein n=1 Tax=Conexibacter sp. CPCC 206217 TaxID=3064574 RepID=UPI00272677D5|nr:SGNH/GDSL hydrolase family protein [Conexibacter sp. CPCC 206217]MDO8211324.1 SGNH/GDSL hydrolase family protein [Conexibacter sp. CPCC 206217]